MKHWTRNDSMLLGRMAIQVGFASVDEAYEALEIGARLKAYGFTQRDVDDAVRRFALDGFDA